MNIRLAENQEHFVAVLAVAAILAWLGLSNRDFWNLVVSLTFAWAIADYLAGSLESESTGYVEVRGRTLPIRRVTTAFCAYFVAIVFASLVSEYFLTPLLLSLLGIVVQNAVNREQAYVMVVSFSASALVFLNLRWRTQSDHDATS